MDGGDSWTQMASTGAFLSAIGVRPVMDVLWTTGVQPGNTEHIAERHNIEHELVVAVLTTGPVGFGDMVNGTNSTRLALATRADGVILKPAHTALRVDDFYAAGNDCAGAEVWSAASAVARSVSSSEDRRANSFARLDADAGLGAGGADGVWWFSILSTRIDTTSTCKGIGTDSLWPASQGSSFVSFTFGQRCTAGAAASSCLTPFSADSGKSLVVATGTSATERLWMLQSLAPVLPGGWVLVGEMSKYVPVSPQRLVVTAAAAAAAAASGGGGGGDSAGASDAFDTADIVSNDGSTLMFDVVGAAGEKVDITVVVPPAPAAAAAGVSAQGPGESAGRKVAGTIRTIHVTLPAAGRKTVTCTPSSC